MGAYFAELFKYSLVSYKLSVEWLHFDHSSKADPSFEVANLFVNVMRRERNNVDAHENQYIKIGFREDFEMLDKE